MVSQYEAAQLQRDMQRELEGSPAVLVKSVVGLAVVVMLSLGSTGAVFEGAGSQQASSAAAAQQL